MKLVTVEQMRRNDAYTIEHHVPSMELIRRAAYSVFREVSWNGTIGIVVGSGNNGADGFALACILQEHNMNPAVFTVSSRLHRECALWAEEAAELGVRIMPYKCGCLGGFDILVDCMLGTGFSGALKQNYSNAIREINRSEAYVVSVDINSGMNGDSGAGECIVFSDLTVTVEFVKRGQLTVEAEKYMRRLVCVEIGIVDICEADELTEEMYVSCLERESKKYV